MDTIHIIRHKAITPARGPAFSNTQVEPVNQQVYDDWYMEWQDVEIAPPSTQPIFEFSRNAERRLERKKDRFEMRPKYRYFGDDSERHTQWFHHNKLRTWQTWLTAEFKTKNSNKPHSFNLDSSRLEGLAYQAFDRAASKINYRRPKHRKDIQLNPYQYQEYLDTKWAQQFEMAVGHRKEYPYVRLLEPFTMTPRNYIIFFDNLNILRQADRELVGIELNPGPTNQDDLTRAKELTKRMVEIDQAYELAEQVLDEVQYNVPTIESAYDENLEMAKAIRPNSSLNYFGNCEGMEVALELDHKPTKTAQIATEPGFDFKYSPPSDLLAYTMGRVQHPTGQGFGLSTKTTEDSLIDWGSTIISSIGSTIVGALGHILEGDNKVEGNVEMIEESPTVTSLIDVATTPGNADIRWSMANLFKRPRSVTSFTWSTADSSWKSKLNLTVETLISRHPLRESVLQQFAYYRFSKLNIRFLMQTNPFYAGILRIVYVPGLVAADDADLTYILQSGKGTEVFVAQGEQMVLSVPWTFPRKWMSQAFPGGTTSPKMGSLGRIVVGVLLPLQVAEGNAESISIEVLADFEGMEFAVPKQYDVPYVFEQTAAKLESHSEETYYYPTTSRYNTNYSSASMTPNHNTGSGSNTLKTKKELSTNYLGAIWTFRENVKLAATLPSKTLLSTFPLYGPKLTNSSFATLDVDKITTNEPVALLAQSAAFYAGSRCFRISVAKNCFQRAKLLIAYIPAGYKIPNMTAAMAHPYIIWEMASSNVFEFRVAEMHDRSLTMTPRYAHVNYPDATNKKIVWQGVHRGYVVVYVFSPLVSPTGSPQSVDLTVWQSWYPGDLNGNHRLRLFAPITGVYWDRTNNKPYAQPTIQTEAITPQSFWANAQNVHILGEDIQNSADISTSAEEINDMTYLMQRSQLTLYNTKESGPPPRIPLRIGMMNTPAGTNTEHMPDQHIQLFSSLFAYWGGSLQFMVLGDVDVMNVRALPNACGAPEGFNTNPNFGAASGMQILQGGAKTNSITVGDIGPSDFYHVDKYDIKVNDTFDFYGADLLIDSYDSSQLKYGTRFAVYMSAAPDFWLGGYQFFDKSTVVALLNKQNSAAHFPPLVEEEPTPPPKIELINEEVSQKMIYSTPKPQRRTMSSIFRPNDEAFRFKLDSEIQLQGAFDAPVDESDSGDYATSHEQRQTQDSTSSDEDSEEEPVVEGFVAGITHLPRMAHKTMREFRLTTIALKKEIKVLTAKLAKMTEVAQTNMTNIKEDLKTATTKVSDSVTNMTNNATSKIDALETLIKSELTRLTGILPTRETLSLYIILLIDLCEGFYFNNTEKWCAFAIKVAIHVGLNFSIIARFSAFVSNMLSIPFKSAEGTRLEAASDNQGLLASGLAIVVMAIGLHTVGADNFDDMKNKDMWTRLTDRARQLHFGKLGLAAIKETFETVRGFVIEFLNEYVLSYPINSELKDCDMNDEISYLSGEFAYVSSAENLPQLAIIGTVKTRFLAAHARFVTLRNNMTKVTVTRDTFMRFGILRTLVDKLETGGLDNFNGQEQRWDPLHICFVGATELGKSALMARMANILLDSQKEPTDHPRIYQISPGVDHFDNYDGRRAMTIDDMDAIEDPEKINQYMLMKSNNPVILPMASLMKKGMYFQADLIISSSNVESPKPKCMPCPEAYLRRRDLNIKVDWDPEKPKEKAFDFSHLRFSILRQTQNGTVAGPSYTFDVMAGYLAHIYSKHLVNQAKLARASGRRPLERPIIDYNEGDTPRIGRTDSDIVTIIQDVNTKARFASEDTSIDDIVTRAGRKYINTLAQPGEPIQPNPVIRTRQPVRRSNRDIQILRDGEHLGPCIPGNCPPLCPGDPTVVLEIQPSPTVEDGSDDEEEYNETEITPSVPIPDCSTQSGEFLTHERIDDLIARSNSFSFQMRDVDGNPSRCLTFHSPTGDVVVHGNLGDSMMSYIVSLFSNEHWHHEGAKLLLRHYHLSEMDVNSFGERLRYHLELSRISDLPRTTTLPHWICEYFKNTFLPESIRDRFRTQIRETHNSRAFQIFVDYMVRGQRYFLESWMDKMTRNMTTDERALFEVSRLVTTVTFVATAIPLFGFTWLRTSIQSWIMSLFSHREMGWKTWIPSFCVANTLAWALSLGVVAGGMVLAYFTGKKIQKWRNSKDKVLIEGDKMPIQTHAHADLPNDGKAYTHVHMCEKCNDAFTHKHQKRSEEVSKTFVHWCAKCRNKAKKASQAALAGGQSFTVYYPDEADYTVEQQVEKTPLPVLKKEGEKLELQHKGYASDRGLRLRRIALRTEADKRAILIEGDRIPETKEIVKLVPITELFDYQENELKKFNARLTRIAEPFWKALKIQTIPSMFAKFVHAYSYGKWTANGNVIDFGTNVDPKLLKRTDEEIKLQLETWTNTYQYQSDENGVFNPKIRLEEAPAERPNMLAVELGMSEYVEPVKMEMFEDQGAMNVATLIRGNSGIITHNGQTMNYVGLKEQKVLTLAHLVDKEMTRAFYTFNIWRFGMEYEITVPNSALKRRELKNSMTPDGQHQQQRRLDYLVIDFSSCPKMNAFANITKHFIKEENMDLVAGSNGQLLVRFPSGKEKNQNITIEATRIFPNTGRIYESGYVLCMTWQYNAGTAPGYCGSALVVENPMIPQKIIGIHQSSRGPNEKIAYAAPVTYEMIQELCGIQTYINGTPLKNILNDNKLEGLDVNKISNNAPTGRYVNIGTITRSGGTILKSDLRQSPLFDKVFKHVTEPAVLKQSDPRNTSGIHPLKNGLQKFDRSTGDWNPYFRQRARLHLLHLMMKNQDQYTGPRRLLTTYEAINGIPGHIEKLNMRTSPGFPFIDGRESGTIGKTSFFNVIGTTSEGAEIYEPTPELQKLIDEIEEHARVDNEVVSNYYIDWPKDERRPIEKIAVAKTRLFNIANVAWLIVCKKHFGAFTAAQMKIRFNMGSALGMNMHGPDVTALVNHLQYIGNNMADGDVEKWDGGFDFETITDCATLNALWLKHYNRELDYWFTMTVGLSPTWRIHICGNAVYLCSIGIPSGIYMTSLYNTNGHAIRNLQLMMEEVERVILKLAIDQNRQAELAFWIGLRNLSTLCEHYRMVVGGDDEVISVSNEIKQEITPASIARAWKNHGITYVPPQKISGQAHADTWDTIETVQFYKCHFKRDSINEDYWHMAFDAEPMRELVNWVRTGAPPEEMLAANVRDFQHFAYAHGRKFFDEETEKVKIGAEAENLVIPFRFYEELDAEWRYEHELTGSYSTQYN